MASSSQTTMASSSSQTTQEEMKKLILRSSDGQDFELEQSAAIQSGTIKNMVDDDCSIFPLPNVDTQTLAKITEYMKEHAAATPETEDKIKDFDKEFVNTTLQNLLELILAANYMDIKPLFDLLSQTIADRIKNKTVKAVRQIFNITNDYTEEEEKQIYKDHEWAHEGELDDSLL